MFLRRIPKDRVEEGCRNMKESLRKVAEEVFPKARQGDLQVGCVGIRARQGFGKSRPKMF